MPGPFSPGFSSGFGGASTVLCPRPGFGSNDHESALAALFAYLQTACALSFTGNSADASAVISGITDTCGLVKGLPVFGPGVAKLAVIASIDSDTQITLDQPIGRGHGGSARNFTAGFQLIGRRRKDWSECIGEQPALFLEHTKAQDEYVGGIFPRTTLETEIWIYSRAGEDPNVAPDIALNALCWLVRASLAIPDDFMTNQLTLGGLCQWCRVEGDSDYSPGSQDGQSIAAITVKILLT